MSTLICHFLPSGFYQRHRAYSFFACTQFQYPVRELMPYVCRKYNCERCNSKLSIDNLHSYVSEMIFKRYRSQNQKRRTHIRVENPRTDALVSVGCTVPNLRVLHPPTIRATWASGKTRRRPEVAATRTGGRTETTTTSISRRCGRCSGRRRARSDANATRNGGRRCDSPKANHCSNSNRGSFIPLAGTIQGGFIPILPGTGCVGGVGAPCDRRSLVVFNPNR